MQPLRLVLLSALLLIHGFSIRAQQKPPLVTTPVTGVTVSKQVTTNIIAEKDYVQIFEYPGYSGKSVTFFMNTDNKNVHLPFSSNSISIRFSNDKKMIVHLLEIGNNPNIHILTGSTPNYTVQSENIAVIRVGTKMILEVDFNGFIYQNSESYSSTIHNNDCKKIYGQVAYELSFTMTNGSANSTAKAGLLNAYTGLPNGKVELFNKEKGTDYTCPFVYPQNQANLTPTVGREGGRFFSGRHTVLRTVADVPKAKQYYFIDSAMYEFNNRCITMRVDVNIGSAHKGCDLCTDFTWDAAMKNGEVKNISLPNDFQSFRNNASGSLEYLDFIQAGPYRARNIVNGVYQSNFTGPEHPTYIQITTRRIPIAN